MKIRNKFCYFILNREILENAIIICRIRKLDYIYLSIEKDINNNILIYINSDKGTLLFTRPIIFISNLVNKEYKEFLISIKVNDLKEFMISSNKMIVEFLYNKNKNFSAFGEVNFNINN